MIKIIPSRISPIPKSLLRISARTIGTHTPRRARIENLRAPVVLSRRCYATSGIPNHENTSQAPKNPSGPLPESEHSPNIPPLPPRKPSWLRPLLWATFGLMIGITTGKLFTIMISPPAMPEPDSPTDALLVTDIQARAAKLPIVQQLSASPEWKSWDAYNGYDVARKTPNFTAGVLKGARAIGAYQRVWWNEETGEVITVFWIGGSVSGWPGVAHGGLLATILDESLARCVMLPRKSAVVTANLNVTYRAPAHTNSFFIIRSLPVAEGSTDRKGYVQGTLEELDGRVCVEANGLFVVPKKMKLGQMTEQGAKGF